jgi:hypothetical protein
MTVPIHTKSLNAWKDEMYSTLVYPHHCATKGTLVRREFYTEAGYMMSGKKECERSFECDYYVIRNSDIGDKYCLTEEMIRNLPIKITSSEKLFDRKSDEVVYFPTTYKTFKIVPERKMHLRELIAPFIHKHASPKEYEQHIVTAFATYIFRINIWKSGFRGFGKSSIYKTMGLVFDNCEVREGVETVPAFYKYIPSEGTMVLDELKKKDNESAEEIWYVLNQAGDKSNETLRMKTGGSPRHGTHVPKNIKNCSFVCLFNRLQDYTSPSKFAEFMFNNNISLERRYLKFKLSDTQLDLAQFSSVSELTEEHRKTIIDMNKTLRWYMPHYDRETFSVRCGLKEECDLNFVEKSLKQLGEAYDLEHHDSLLHLCMVYYVYCKQDYVRYMEMMEQLATWILDYKVMVGSRSSGSVDMGETMSMVDTNRGEQPKVTKVSMIKYNSANSKLKSFEEDAI